MSRQLRFEATAEEHRVTTLELFFDLVFVFAFTQITALMAAQEAGDGATQNVVRGLVLLALIWFAWAAYSWLGNQARADEGVLRVAMVVAMGAIFVAALAIPEAWEDAPGGLNGPLVLACAIAVVRLVHLATYAVAAADDEGLRRQLGVVSVPVVAAAGLLIAGALIGGRWQTTLWLLALLVDYGGMFAAGTRGWRLRSPSHFAERHGLIVIIALGESIVAVGVGVADLPITAPIILASLLGLAVAVTLWWLYFDVVALVAEHTLTELPPEDRPRRARNSYSYLHLPMIAGIVIMAVGLKKVSNYVGDTESHDLADPLSTFGLVMLFVGPAVYLLAHVTFRWLNVRTLNVQRLVVAAVLLVAIPLCSSVPALGALAVLVVVLGGLVAYEFVRLGEARDHIRHARVAQVLPHREQEQQ